MTKTTSNSPKTATASKPNQVETAASAPKGAPVTGKPPQSAGTAQPGTTAASSVKIVPAAEKVPIPSPLPKSWSDIKAGSLVIGYENAGNGWWEAVILRVEGDVFTLRWRDFPSQKPVKRTRKEIALLYAGD